MYTYLEVRESSLQGATPVDNSIGSIDETAFIHGAEVPHDSFVSSLQ